MVALLHVMCWMLCQPECPKCGVRVAKWRVLLDCAKLATSTPLDLTAVRPDFVMISFYKILGYPTGLGALLVRNDALPLLKKVCLALPAAFPDVHFARLEACRLC
jgi:hypothetical protein